MRKFLIIAAAATVLTGGYAFAQAESNNSANATGAWQNNYQSSNGASRPEETAGSIAIHNGTTVAKRKAARIAVAKANAQAKAVKAAQAQRDAS
ncbi:MAG: hypothetical protein ABW063_01520 [Caulobacter sp.]